MPRPAAPAPEHLPPDDVKSAADAIQTALVDLFLMPSPEETVRRACIAVRDIFHARRCWMHGLPLAYDPGPDLSLPGEATYCSSDSDTPPPISPDVLRNLYTSAQAPFPKGLAPTGPADAAPSAPAPGSSRILRPLSVNGSPWGILAVEDPSPDDAASPAVQELFRSFTTAIEGLLNHITRGERLRVARQLIEKVAEELPVAVFLVNRTHQIVFLNRRTLEIAHMTREEIIRKGCFGPFCDQQAHYEKCPGHASLHTGEPWDGEADIEGHHYKVSVRPLHIGDTIPYSVVILGDDTEAFHQRHVLANTIGRITTLLDRSTRIRHCLESFATSERPEDILSIALREAIALFHSPYTFLVRFQPDGSLVRVHSQFSNEDYNTSFLTPETRGRIARHFPDATDLVYQRGQTDPHDDDIEDMLAASGSQSVYFGAINLNGKKWGYLGSLSNEKGPFSTSDLEIRHDIVNLVEIAVHRASLVAEIASREKSLVEAAEQARASAKAKTMFLATMSHEIRTPLNAIIGFAEILGRSEGLSDEARECSDGITRSANTLLDLLNDILDLSKLESGATVMRRGQCNLPAIFKEMATIFRYSAHVRGISLEYDIPATFPLLLLDGPRIRQVLLNLVGNAVKFTEHGFVKWTASCTPAANGAVDLAIDVQDSGIGIPADRLDTIFDPFVQVSNFRPDARANQNGTGLGLSIVQRLVSACGGTVSVQSAVGKGSRFSIRVENVETIAQTAPAPASASAEGLTLGPDFVPLLVDDIDLNLHILALHLRSLGSAAPLLAKSGQEALDAIRKHRPSIVFTDLWMPGMDGAALARAIRTNPALAGIPVVAVTADSDASASFDASVFDDILVKPLVTEKVAECIANLLHNA